MKDQRRRLKIKGTATKLWTGLAPLLLNGGLSANNKKCAACQTTPVCKISKKVIEPFKSLKSRDFDPYAPIQMKNFALWHPDETGAT